MKRKIILSIITLLALAGCQAQPVTSDGGGGQEIKNQAPEPVAPASPEPAPFPAPAPSVIAQDEKINDLEVGKFVKLDATLQFQADEKAGDGSQKIIISTQHDFTNSLSCDVYVGRKNGEYLGPVIAKAIPVYGFKSEDNSYSAVVPADKVIWGDNGDSQDPVNGDITVFTFLDGAFRYQVKLSGTLNCQGQDPRTLLPPEICKKTLSADVTNMCKSLGNGSEKASFPVIDHGNLLGSCECD